ncbi:spore cortex biosynthesis protein YabQ [Massiliimalia massiliensis]|uniref:spore cortex biosynthesis protein YabQ n=1 Tax=Massiliimalia massiliensis TaxID=1852384 RepID=UPI0009845E87
MLFFQACLLGVILGIIYDCFRVFRQFIPSGKIFTFFQDLLFFFTATLFTFLFLVATNHGQLRIYLIAGELLGIWLYFQSVSRIVLWLTHQIIRLLKKIFSPIIRLIQWLFCQIKKLFLFMKKHLKNICGKRFFPLKKGKRIVYNKGNDKRKGGVFLWHRKAKPEDSKGSSLR